MMVYEKLVCGDCKHFAGKTKGKDGKTVVCDVNEDSCPAGECFEPNDNMVKKLSEHTSVCNCVGCQIMREMAKNDAKALTELGKSIREEQMKMKRWEEGK